jgi:uncharacterized protein YciI
MPYFAMFYDVVDDYVSRRAPFRQEHLALARAAHERGDLVIAGAFAEPADRALLVFKGPDSTIAEAFAAADPYVINGLVTKVTVRRWNVVVPAEPQP